MKKQGLMRPTKEVKKIVITQYALDYKLKDKIYQRYFQLSSHHKTKTIHIKNHLGKSLRLVTFSFSDTTTQIQNE